jgi:hypothetical protein
MKITAFQRMTVLLTLVCLSLGPVVPAAHALQAVNLAWNASASASVAGYTINYGTSASNLNLTANAGNSLSTTISNLADGQTYFFVATAYTFSGLVSAPSNMVVYTTAVGTTSQSPVSYPNLASGSFIGYSGDFSGNGKQDILWRNMQTGEVDIWFMDGASVVSQANLGTVGLNWQIVGTADFTGDGRSDILWQNTADGSFGIWVMNGSSYAGYGFPSQGSEWAIVGVANLGHTGPGAIFWRNVGTGELVVWTTIITPD